MCRASDAAYATSAGASFIGVILAPGRSRTRTLSQAAAIFDAAGAGRVGVFVDAPAADVLAAAERLRLDVVQLHGDEPPATVDAIVREQVAQVWKARRVRDAGDVATAVREYESAHGLLLDGWSPHAHGGAGASFDWSAIASLRASVPPRQKLILAGGLRADNVASAIALLTPDVVDVSSGVEAELCSKSTELIDAFIAAARGAKDGI